MTSRRNRRAEREARQEQARLRKERNMTDEERLADYRRRRVLFDNYVWCTSNVKKNLFQRRRELEARINYFVNSLSHDDRQTEGYLIVLIYKQGIFDGKLHQLRTFFFQEMRKEKPALVRAGVDKAEKIDAELNRIEMMFQTLTENSHQFSGVLRIHFVKQQLLSKIMK